MTDAGEGPGGGHVLAVAESRGSCEALAPLVAAFRRRGFRVRSLAVGTAREAEGFGDPAVDLVDGGVAGDPRLVRGASLLLTGLTGPASRERQVAAMARAAGIPVAGVADNLDRMADRISPDERDRPDLVLVSGGIGLEPDRQDLSAAFGATGAGLAGRLVPIGNLRADAAIARRAGFGPHRREQVMARAFPGIDASLFDRLRSGETRLVVLYTQNMRPQARHWASYRLTIDERSRLFRASLAITARVLSVLASMPGVVAALRPHPGEDAEPSVSLSADFGALHAASPTVDSLDLALAAGHIVSPASSMLDQGALLGVRTLAILWDQHGPFRFEALARGAVLAVDSLDQTETALAELVAPGPEADAAWGRRLGALERTPAAEGAVTIMIERFGLSP
jgi:hypothetical protein